MPFLSMSCLVFGHKERMLMDECFSSGYHDCSMFVFVFFLKSKNIPGLSLD